MQLKTSRIRSAEIMKEEKMIKIWMNIDPKSVDVSYLEKHFSDKCIFLAKAVAADDKKQIRDMAGCSDIIISGIEKWDAATLFAARGRLKFLQKYGMGIDNIDLEAASEYGILVANIRGANSASVAEVAFMHILNVCRYFVPCVNGVKSGIWPSFTRGHELDGKTVGLLGFGNIAQHLARMLGGFRVQILAYDPYLQTVPAETKVEFVSTREELFERSDIVSLHIPCTEETKGSINHTLFNRMRDGACLINTCRGGVINTSDFADALKNGKIAAAGLDVMTAEPPDINDPLMKLDNVFISSHMGAETEESNDRSLRIMGEAIDTFMAGGIPKFACNAEDMRKFR